MTTPIGTFTDDTARAMALQADGKILAAGQSRVGAYNDFALVRHNANGSLDTSFGIGGKVTTPIGNKDDVLRALAVQPDGKIVVAGRSDNGIDFDFALARYHSDGSLDSSFGVGGKVTTPIGNSADRGYAMALQPDGKIVVTGYSTIAGSDDFAVVRYNADGSLDASFGNNGKITTPIGSGTDQAFAMALQPDGKIVAAGFSTVGGVDAFALARYNPEQLRAFEVLAGPNGLTFDPTSGGFGAGQLVHGTNNAFDGLNRLQIASVDFAPANQATNLLDDGQTLVTPSQAIAGLDVHREITVPNSGGQDFARTIEVLTNSTASPITASVRIVGNLGSDAATTVFETSDGDTLPETTDEWIGTDDADGTNTPAIVQYIRGPLGVQPTSVVVTGDNIEWTYEITVPANETVRLATFTILANDRATAKLAAAALVSSAGLLHKAGAFLEADELESLANFQFQIAPHVTGEYVFYNNSAYASAADDDAIAINKAAILSGGTATFANYTSYSRAINGIMLDVVAMPGALTTSDFQFRVGNDETPGGWDTVSVPASITLRSGAGDGGSDRVTLIWPDGAIKNTWLQVVVLPTPTTGLAEPYVFYFGNAVGDSGDSQSNAVVNSTDELGARGNHKTFLDPAAIDNVYDFNRDGFVNATDQILARGSSTTLATALKLISVPGGMQASSASAPPLLLREDKSLAGDLSLVESGIAICLAAPVNRTAGLLATSLTAETRQPPSASFAYWEVDDAELPEMRTARDAGQVDSRGQDLAPDEQLYELITGDLLASRG